MQNNYLSSDVSEKIKKRLKESGRTAEQMLSELEMGKRTLQNYKTSMPKADNLAYIADYLECSVDYLLGRTDNPEICSSQNFSNKNGVQVVSSNDTNVSYHNGFISSQDKELLELIQGLSLKQRAKVITFIYDTMEKK